MVPFMYQVEGWQGGPAGALILAVNDLCLKLTPRAPNSYTFLICLTSQETFKKMAVCSQQSGRPISLAWAVGDRKGDVGSRSPSP